MGLAVEADLRLYFNPGLQKVLPTELVLTAQSTRSMITDETFFLALMRYDQVVCKVIPIILEILRGEAAMSVAERALFWDLGSALAMLELTDPKLFAAARSTSYTQATMGSANTVLGALCRVAVTRDRIIALLRVQR